MITQSSSLLEYSRNSLVSQKVYRAARVVVPKPRCPTG